jgi:hypothetical protein
MTVTTASPAHTGPVRPIGEKNGVIDLSRDTQHRGWMAAKTLWISQPRYQGPILRRIRGLDGHGPAGLLGSSSFAPRAEGRSAGNLNVTVRLRGQKGPETEDGVRSDWADRGVVRHNRAESSDRDATESGPPAS